VTTALPVLTFHAIDDADSVISYEPGLFSYAMDRLHAAGYRTISLSEALGHLRDGRPFPSHAFAVTFDDGFQSVYTDAFPALHRHGMTATVFLTVGSTPPASASGRLAPFEGRAMLSWPEIREMRAAGIDFGAHTLSHPDLTRTSADQVEHEMTASKAVIEDALGTPVTTFAYPFGLFDDQSRRIAARHFSGACADTLGILSPRSDPYALERVDAYYLRSRRLLALATTALFPWYVLARAVPRGLRRWVQGRRP
jgi:peptidoglycan/xylan/chitin deacetylase (PgdA/CDA1 family)